MPKITIPANNIMSEIEQRWSPRSFSLQDVEHEKLQQIFEAARWAPSAMNEQPWRFFIGLRNDNDYKKILECLVAGNRVWAISAPVLVLACAMKKYKINDTINPWSNYDLGQAVAYLSIQAMHENIYVHQMGGFVKEKAETNFSLSADIIPVSVLALGYLGDSQNLPQDLRERELAPSVRIKKEAFILNT